MLLHVHPPPFPRGDIEQFAKGADKASLIGKSAFERDLNHRQTRMQQKLFRYVNTLLQQPAVRRLSGSLLESADEVAYRELTFTRYLRERDLPVQLCPQHLLSTM